MAHREAIEKHLFAALDLRAGMGFIAPPTPPPEKYIDVSYYEAR